MWLTFNPQTRMFSVSLSIYEERVDPVSIWFPYPVHAMMIAQIIGEITGVEPVSVEWDEQRRGTMVLMKGPDGPYIGISILEPSLFKLRVHIDGQNYEKTGLTLEEGLTNFMIDYYADRQWEQSVLDGMQRLWFPTPWQKFWN